MKLKKKYVSLENFKKALLLVCIMIMIFPLLYLFFDLYIYEQYNREYNIIEYIKYGDYADSHIVLGELREKIDEKDFKTILNILAYCGSKKALLIAINVAEIHQYHELYDLYNKDMTVCREIVHSKMFKIFGE